MTPPAPAQDTIAFLEGIELTELHAHLGMALSATELWEMAHDQGLKLPTKEYREFERLVNVYEAKDFEEQLKIYDLTEKIQSSPEAMFHAVQHVISEAYRKNNITTLELRFNPIFRCQDGERDMDHILVFALQGLERAQLKYGVRAGLILCMDRRLPVDKNAAIVKKAIKYKDRGVVGIDVAGPVQRFSQSQTFRPKDIAHLAAEAREVGLGVTFHTGEVTGVDEMWEVLNEVKPDRIGHGIACVNDKKMMEYLQEKNIALELCPSSNIHTKVLKDYREVKKVVDVLKENKVPFTINTDWPASLRLPLRLQFAQLLETQVLTKEDVLVANTLASQVSFIK